MNAEAVERVNALTRDLSEVLALTLGNHAAMPAAATLSIAFGNLTLCMEGSVTEDPVDDDGDAILGWTCRMIRTGEAAR